MLNNVFTGFQYQRKAPVMQNDTVHTRHKQTNKQTNTVSSLSWFACMFVCVGYFVYITHTRLFDILQVSACLLFW